MLPGLMRLAVVCVVCVPSLCSLQREYQRTQRWQGERQGPGATVSRHCLCLHTPEVAAATATVTGRIGVQSLPVVAGKPDTDAEALVRHRCHVQHDQQLLIGHAALAAVDVYRLLGVVRIDPLET